jgi:hypothetical protein
MGEPTEGEVELDLQTAGAPFADQRIFSANARTFLEFDRPSGQRRDVSYDDVIPSEGNVQNGHSGRVFLGQKGTELDGALSTVPIRSNACAPLVFALLCLPGG